MAKTRCPVTCALLLFLSASSFAQDQSTASLLSRAVSQSEQGNSAEAVKLLNQLIEQAPETDRAYYLRGREHFRLGKIKESVGDFDQYVQLRPELENRLWERGISNYYNKQYKEGAEQFALYQTYYNNDVENSVWRFACMARSDGVDKARAALMPIENDRRVPMMEIYGLFKGVLAIEDVFAAARKGAPAEQVVAGRMFYANLYVGLYCEATNEPKLAKKYIQLAADYRIDDSEPVNHYMWDVARVHAQLLSEPVK